jgi:hypothetical protein
MYVFGWRSSVCRLCDSDFGITPYIIIIIIIIIIIEFRTYIDHSVEANWGKSVSFCDSNVGHACACPGEGKKQCYLILNHLVHTVTLEM